MRGEDRLAWFRGIIDGPVRVLNLVNDPDPGGIQVGGSSPSGRVGGSHTIKGSSVFFIGGPKSFGAFLRPGRGSRPGVQKTR